ncbi:MAG: hypothetical protein OEL91_01270 [Burkholderiaceae bacterium]|nr:hypothetical protein [Burkholderiaceae bacterium]
MTGVAADLTALRRLLGTLSRDELLIVAERALEMVPNAELPSLLGNLVQVEGSVEAPPRASTLLEEARVFHAISMSGGFYDSFDVNARNCTQQSGGTGAFTAKFDRLIARCVREADNRPHQTVCEALEILFGLLRHIDEGRDDVIFFADEGGSWNLGVDWPRALPAYFRCLAETTTAEEFTRTVDQVITDFVEHDRGRYLSEAWRVATAAQQASLSALAAAKK